MYFLAICLCLFSVSGCVLVYPQSSVVSQTTTGRVVDAKTGMPIACARLVKTDVPETATLTESGGHFQMNMVKDHHIVVANPANGVLIPSPRDCRQVIEISRDGYQSRTVDVAQIAKRKSPKYCFPAPLELGTIRLVPE